MAANVVWGWYSAIQDYQFGHCIWQSESGEHVIVTEVADDESYQCRWPDAKRVGKFVKCIQGNDRWMDEQKKIESDPFGYARQRLAQIERERKINAHGMN